MVRPREDRSCVRRESGLASERGFSPSGWCAWRVSFAYRGSAGGPSGVQPQWVVRMARLLRVSGVGWWSERGSAPVGGAHGASPSRIGGRLVVRAGFSPSGWCAWRVSFLWERAASWDGSCRLPKARILSEMFKFTSVHPGSDTKEQLSGQLPDPEVAQGPRLLSVSSGVLTASSLMV